LLAVFSLFSAFAMKGGIEPDPLNHVFASHAAILSPDIKPDDLEVQPNPFLRRIDEALPSTSLSLLWPLTRLGAVARAAGPKKVPVELALPWELGLWCEVLYLESSVGIQRANLFLCRQAVSARILKIEPQAGAEAWVESLARWPMCPPPRALGVGRRGPQHLQLGAALKFRLNRKQLANDASQRRRLTGRLLTRMFKQLEPVDFALNFFQFKARNALLSKIKFVEQLAPSSMETTQNLVTTQREHFTAVTIRPVEVYLARRFLSTHRRICGASTAQVGLRCY